MSDAFPAFEWRLMLVGIIEEHSSNWIVEAMRMRAGISIPLRKLFLLATAAGIFVPTIAEGQILPPEFKAVNDQNIDVLTASDSYISGGSVNITEPIISMYGIENPITYTRNLIREGGWWDSLKYLIDDSNATRTFGSCITRNNLAVATSRFHSFKPTQIPVTRNVLV